MAKIPINLSTGSIQKEEIILGIDLGTTNSLIAFIDPDNNPRVINDTGKGLLVPSIIYFNPNKEILIGNEAKPYLTKDPKNTIFSVKRLLGRSFKDIEKHSDFFSYKIIDDNAESLVKVQVQENFYTPIELSSFILKELKSRAEHALKTPVNKVVITVPAYFNDSQRQATRDAGKLAGMDVLRIINEPTAASLAYGIGLNKEESKTIAVYDLGGGTFDISILKIENGIFEVLSTNGNTYLGGDDFDKKIIEHWIEKYNLSTLKKQNAINTQELRLLAEKAKIHLSENDFFEATFDENKLELSKINFEKLIRPLIDESIDCCKKAMKDADLKIEEIEAVLLVGGSTRSPFVKKQVQEFFNKIPNDSLNPDQVVALGAAIQADILAGNRKDILLLDVTPLSLGIETMGGLMDVIIPRNSKIPTKHGRQYTTSKDGQGTLKIAVYQGERDLVSENRKLAEFILNGIPGMPAGFPKIDIQFMLNADGILKVKATELRSGLEQSIEVVPSYGISDEVVEKMLIDSMLHAKEDIAKRMILEAQNEAQQLIYTVENFITKNGKFLQESEILNTKNFIEELKKSLENGDKNSIHLSIEKLNEHTRPFAEKIMDIAIAEAMKGKKI